MIMPTTRDEGRGLAGGWKRGHPGRGVLTSDAEQPWHREQAGGTPAAGQSRKMLYQLSPERQGVCTCVCSHTRTHTHAAVPSPPCPTLCRPPPRPEVDTGLSLIGSCFPQVQGPSEVLGSVGIL